MAAVSGARRMTVRPRRAPWLESVAAVGILWAAWLYGLLTTHSPIAPLVTNVLPGAARVAATGEIFTAYAADGQVLGYAAAADATGYGGPIYLLVGVDAAGEIAGVQVIEQRETPGFYALLQESDFVQGFLGQPAGQPLVVGVDVASVSGASLSAEAVAQAIYAAAQKIQTGTLAASAPPLRFGLPEISLLALFGGGLLLPRLRRSRAKKALRWALLLSSLVVLGFVLNQPLTLANFASLLAGYWPAWQDHLYWYLLLGGAVAFVLLTGKNTYCAVVCPFGAVQECFGKLSNARPLLPPALYGRLQWVPRWLAVLALALGLAFRQPGAASFEPFGTLFSFSAGFFPWMLLVFVLFASLLILRPFCYYLCPVKVVLDFLLFLRNQAKRQWQNRWAAPTP
jgi:hypothetical protein